MIRFVVMLALAISLTWCGATVKLGERTFFGHVRAIWATDEVQDLKHGVQETAGPAVEKVKRGVKAGIEAAQDSGSGSGAGTRGPGTLHVDTTAPVAP